MTGERVGQYTVLEKIGEGGMGAVWKARDEKLGRVVALKFLSQFNDADRRARFTQEARSASALNHPGIVTIFDIVEHGDKACIVMEYVQGTTLAGSIPAGGMPAREVVRLGAQIADALAAAHKAGIIHRDLKPGNVMITSEGRAKLLDFGLAKLSELATAPADQTRTIEGVQTLEGTILGTVNYMSPEQAQGKAVDVRSDIFSLGTVLYEMATGRKAFDGETTVSTIACILRDDPKPLSGELPATPRELERVISRCLRKEPDRRFQTAIDVRNALEEVQEELKSGPISAVAAVPAPRRRRAWSVLAAIAGVLAVAVGFGVFGSRKKAIEPAASILIRPFSDLPGYKTYPSFSPDGNTILFAWDGGELGRTGNVYAMLVDGGKPLRLTNTANWDASPFYSPDGRRVYFTRLSGSDMAVYSVPALGGDETRIAPGIAYSLSSGGEWLLLSRASDTNGFRSTSGVLIRQMSTGQERMLVRNSGEFDEFGFQFSPDEKWVYFSRRRIGTPAVAMRVPFAGGDVQQVKIPELEGSLAVIEAVQFFGRNTGMRVMGFDKNGARRGYLMKPDGTRVIALPTNVPTSAGVSPDGRRIIVSVAFGIGPLYRVPAFPDRGEKVVPVKVLDSPRWEASPQFSPDGSRIAVSSGRSGSSMLWLWNAALTEGKPIFEKPSQTTGSPSWSPDGRSIAFDARVKTSQPDIWVAPADGGPARQLTDAPGEDSVPCFDRTGQWIYFTTDREGGMRLYRVPVGGGAQTPVSTRGGFSCQFSPDGKHVYYLQSRSGGELWRHEIATGKEEPVLPAYKNRNFKVLSDGIYLLEIGVASQNTMPATPGAAMFYRFATKKIEKLGFATTKPVGNNGIDLSPDRKWLYYSQVDARASDLQLIENLPF